MGERDISVSSKAIEKFAERVPQATLNRFDGDHFDPLLPPWHPAWPRARPRSCGTRVAA